MEALAAKGADANVAAQGGVTPLHAAAENGGLSVIKALLKVTPPWLVSKPFTLSY